MPSRTVNKNFFVSFIDDAYEKPREFYIRAISGDMPAFEYICEMRRWTNFKLVKCTLAIVA